MKLCQLGALQIHCRKYLSDFKCFSLLVQGFAWCFMDSWAKNKTIVQRGFQALTKLPLFKDKTLYFLSSFLNKEGGCLWTWRETKRLNWVVQVWLTRRQKFSTHRSIMANFGFRHLHHLDILEDTDSYQFLGMLTHYRWWVLTDGLPSPSWPWLPKITAAVHQKKCPHPMMGHQGARLTNKLRDDQIGGFHRWSSDQQTKIICPCQHRVIAPDQRVGEHCAGRF